MSTKLQVQVLPCGANLAIEHNLVMPDTWNDDALAPTLIVSSGFVDSSDASKLICHSGPPDKTSVITLTGAGWNSQVGDTGSATCDLCTNTPGPQTWTVTARS
jgi:hypothetical protein